MEKYQITYFEDAERRRKEAHLMGTEEDKWMEGLLELVYKLGIKEIKYNDKP